MLSWFYPLDKKDEACVNVCMQAKSKWWFYRHTHTHKHMCAVHAWSSRIAADQVIFRRWPPRTAAVAQDAPRFKVRLAQSGHSILNKQRCDRRQGRLCLRRHLIFFQFDRFHVQNISRILPSFYLTQSRSGFSKEGFDSPKHSHPERMQREIFSLIMGATTSLQNIQN